MPRIYLEHHKMGEDMRRLVELLQAEAHGGSTGEFAPPIDVIEHPEAVEITTDLPGLTGDQIQLTFARGVLLIAGFKKPAVCPHTDAAFHVAERAFGRFARAIRISGAVDVGRARASLRQGELRVVLPRISERRGTEIRIPIETD
jgi:HSP20 family protein